MTKSLRHLSFAFALLALAAAAVVAQDKDKSDKKFDSKFDKKSESSLECREYRDTDRLFGHCEIKEQTLAAEILGLRLEGPFINRAKKGAQYEPGIRPPDPLEMEELVAASRLHGRLAYQRSGDIENA